MTVSSLQPIQTERLTLRPFTPDDFDAVYAIQSDPEVARYLYWEARTKDEVGKALELRIARTELRNAGDVLAFAVEERESGVMVGDVDLAWLSAEHQSGEVGFVFNPAYHGRGYATEAATEMLRLGFETYGLHRIIGRLEARNNASARVLEKLGMRREAHFVENEYVKDEWQSELVYAMLASEWRNR